MALRGLSILELSTRAGVARPYLYSVLAGRNAASVDYIARLATVLDIDPADLLGSKPVTRRGRPAKPGV
jgi:transcriptional regulator with XRE-family HTH domain